MNTTDQKLSMLAVVAHPHDITHMCGTLANHVKTGDSVTAVAATGGLKTHREKLRDELKKKPEERDMRIVLQSEEEYGKQKSHEMNRVCRLFGISDVRILPFNDVPFRSSEEVTATLMEIIYEIKPHVVLTHAPLLIMRHGYQLAYHDDHRETGIAVHEAMRMCNIPDSELKRTPHRIAALYYTGVDFPAHEVDYVVDISEHAANRLRAEEIFLSQGHTPDFARKRIEIGAGNFGWRAHLAYGEPWVKARPDVVTHLRPTEYAMGEMNESSEEVFKRLAFMVH